MERGNGYEEGTVLERGDRDEEEIAVCLLVLPLHVGNFSIKHQNSISFT